MKYFLFGVQLIKEQGIATSENYLLFSWTVTVESTDPSGSLWEKIAIDKNHNIALLNFKAIEVARMMIVYFLKSCFLH